jgi:hypothetical protein
MNPSTSHRLVYFTPSPDHPSSYRDTPIFAADEIEELRAFVTFLYPPGGQDTYALLRPDLNDLRWVVWDRVKRETFAAGATARIAVKNANQRKQTHDNHFYLNLTTND